MHPDHADLILQTLRALRSEQAWETILTRVLDVGAHRLASQRDSSLRATLQQKQNEKTSCSAKVDRARVWPHPNASKTLDRPYPVLSGRRKVPKLVNANRVPILRLKKPQSPFLSRIIRNTVDTREKRILSCDRIAKQIPTARHEDQWDDILSRQFGLEDDGYGKRWSYEPQYAYDQIHQLQDIATEKRSRLAAQMHAIVEKEKELVKQEKQSRQNEKQQLYLVRQLPQYLPVTEPARKSDDTQTLPQESTPDMVVHDVEKFKTKEEIQRIQSENTFVRREEEIAQIKATRIRRKEEKAKAKAEKVQRKAKNVQYWNDKLDRQTVETAGAEDHGSSLNRKPARRIPADRLQTGNIPSSQMPPGKPNVPQWTPPAWSNSRAQAKVQ